MGLNTGMSWDILNSDPAGVHKQPTMKFPDARLEGQKSFSCSTAEIKTKELILFLTHKSELSWEVLACPEPLFKGQSISFRVINLCPFSSSEKAQFWNGFFSSEVTAQALTELLELLNIYIYIYADTHKERGEHRAC